MTGQRLQGLALIVSEVCLLLGRLGSQIELAVFIPLLFRWYLVPSGLGDSLSLTGAVARMLGAVITVWLTTRDCVFPARLGLYSAGAAQFLQWGT